MSAATVDLTSLSLARFLTAWPGSAFILDETGTVLAHSAEDPRHALRRTQDVRRRAFFGDVVVISDPRDLNQLLADVAAGSAPIRASLMARLADTGAEVEVQVRRIEAAGQSLLIAVVEDRTRALTAERALAASMGEASGPDMLDPHTGCFSKRQFDFMVPIELRRGHRHGFPIALVVLDLAFESRGPAGSKRAALRGADLRLAADAVRAGLRQHDACFRFSGARLYLLLPHADQAGAEAVVDRAARHLATVATPGQDGRPIGLRAGICLATPPAQPVDYLAWALDLAATAERNLGG